MEKWGHLSRCHVYSHSHSLLNIKNGSFFLDSADDSKQLVTVWAKSLTVYKRSYLVLSENDMDY